MAPIMTAQSSPAAEARAASLRQPITAGSPKVNPFRCRVSSEESRTEMGRRWRDGMDIGENLLRWQAVTVAKSFYRRVFRRCNLSIRAWSIEGPQPLVERGNE